MPAFFQASPVLAALSALVLSLGVLGLDLWRQPDKPEPAQAVWPVQGATVSPPVDAVWHLHSAGRIPMPPKTPAAHASSLLVMPPDDPAVLRAFWFAGSRESGPDVQIATAQFERATQQWSTPRFVVNRRVAGAQLGYGLRRIGNPVAWRDTLGRTHLFVVATGLGGWASGRILHLRQDAADAAFVPLRTLPLSWLWNTSHLVRAMPLPLADGGMVLPVYFEIGRKYPLVLRFDAQGEFRGLTRVSRQSTALQPTLLARGPADWLALMRDHGKERLLRVARTEDGGLHWRDAPPPGLPNPDASVAALALTPQTLLLAYNPGPRRAELRLARSSDGLKWAPLAVLASGQSTPRRQDGEPDPGADGDDEFSYPAMVWAPDASGGGGQGSLWISYTEQRRAIAWQRYVWSAPAAAARP